MKTTRLGNQSRVRISRNRGAARHRCASIRRRIRRRFQIRRFLLFQVPKSRPGPSRARLLCCELTEYVEQDATVLVVLNLLRGIDADPGVELLDASICAFGFHLERVAIRKLRLEKICQASE